MVERYIEAPISASMQLRPMELVAACMEQNADALLAHEAGITPPFFDLSSGGVCELVQKLTNYGIRMAAVVPKPEDHSRAFQDFAREANRSRVIRFFGTREEAVEWLTASD